MLTSLTTTAVFRPSSTLVADQEGHPHRPQNVVCRRLATTQSPPNLVTRTPVRQYVHRRWAAREGTDSRPPRNTSDVHPRRRKYGTHQAHTECPRRTTKARLAECASPTRPSGTSKTGMPAMAARSTLSTLRSGETPSSPSAAGAPAVAALLLPASLSFRRLQQ